MCGQSVSHSEPGSARPSSKAVTSCERERACPLAASSTGFVSAVALVEQTISRAALLAGYGAPLDEGVDVEHIAARAVAGDETARRVFVDLGVALGQFLTPWLQAFRPSCLVVGGSIARSWALFEGGLRGEVEQISGLRAVSVAEQLEDAALLGAAYHAAKRR